MWFLDDESVCCQMNQHSAKKEEKCRCREFGISCRDPLSLLGIRCRDPLSLLDKAVSLEDTAVDQVDHHVHSTKDGAVDEPDVQASIGGVQSKALEVEDEASQPDLPHRFIASYSGCYRGCCRVRYKDLVLAFACLLAVANSKIVESPKNTVILKGESTNAIDLTCKSDLGYRLVWYLNKNQSSVKEELYNGYYLRPDVKHYCEVITDEPGKCYLNLTNKAEAAQTYTCFEPGTLAEVSADVIWIGDLTCYDSSTDDLVNLTCNIEFRGNWPPTMEWKKHSIHGEKVLSVGMKTTTVPNQRVTCTLIMEVQKGSMNYSCITKFDIRGKPSNTTATNIPDYNQVWTSSVVIKPEDKMAAGAIAAIAIGSAIIIALPFCIVCFVHAKRRKEKKKYKGGINNFLLLDCLQIIHKWCN